MDTKRITTAPKSSAGTRPFSGATSQPTHDGREGGRPSSDGAKLTTSVRRPTESHWEWIIDRATD